jgi:hypothetical protein
MTGFSLGTTIRRWRLVRPRFLLSLTLLGLIMLPALSLAARMPSTAGPPGPLTAHPRNVTFGIDSSMVLGGARHAHPTQQDLGTRAFGALHWKVWNSRQGVATGTEWIDDCRPSCAEAVYRPYKLHLHVYDPNHRGIFRRMTLRSHRGGTYRASFTSLLGRTGWTW